MKNEVIWLSPMTKAPTLTEKSKKQRDKTKTPPKMGYTTIADRLRTVSSGNDSLPTGVVKTGLRDPNLPLTAIAVWSKGHTFKKNCK